MPRKKATPAEPQSYCIHCGQVVKPIPGSTLISGKTANYRHAGPISCPKGDPLYDEDIR